MQMNHLKIVNNDKSGWTVETVDKSKRHYVLFVQENATRPPGFSNEAYLKWLNRLYLDVFDVEIPHHYFIDWQGNVESIKEDFLRAPIYSLRDYQHDLFVLIEGNTRNIRPQQIASVVEMSEVFYKKHQLSPLDFMFFPDETQRGYVRSSAQRNMINQCVDRIESLNPVFITEHSIRTNVGSSYAPIAFLYPRTKLSVREASEMAGVDHQITAAMNEVVFGEPTDVIKPGVVGVVPDTRKISGRSQADKIAKEAESVHEASKSIFAF